jgi:uncharacterized protein YacL
MVLSVLRALFVLLMAAVGWFFLTDPSRAFGNYTWLTMTFALVLAVLFVCIDILSPRRKLTVFAGTFLGLLVGVFVAYALSFVVRFLVDYVIGIINGQDPLRPPGPPPITEAMKQDIIQYLNLLVGITVCYLTISFVLQTKDDFRFIIPYVEFKKATKGPRPILLDTSVLIDGRITDVLDTGFLESQLIVPQFVIDELQTIADSADKLKRNRGRRGLDVMQKLKSHPRADVVLYSATAREGHEDLDVDRRLVHFAHELNARVLTNDFNLNKSAQLQGVDVINLNDLAAALKPVVLPGERMTVRLLKAGDEPGQGVGYLEDGTMVVVEQGRGHLNQDVEFTVTSALQTKAGRMIFGRIGSDGGAAPGGGGGGAGPGNGQRRGRRDERHQQQTPQHQSESNPPPQQQPSQRPPSQPGDRTRNPPPAA